MKIEFKVHGVNHGQTRVASIVEDVETSSIVDCLEVELSPVKGRHGSVTLRFIGSEIAAAVEIFTQGATVPMEFGGND